MRILFRCFLILIGVSPFFISLWMVFSEKEMTLLKLGGYCLTVVITAIVALLFLDMLGIIKFTKRSKVQQPKLKA